MNINNYNVNSERWTAQSCGIAADAEKNNCAFKLKIYNKVSYPVSSVSEPVRKKMLEECEDFLDFRRKINLALQKADAGDFLFAYADEVFLNTSPISKAGVTEAVPFVEGGMNYHKSIKDAGDISLLACLGASIAVARLHSADIVHMDIKPENMVFQCTDDEQIKVTLIDFDQSCFSGEFDSDSGGSDGYQAPELVELMESEDEDNQLLKQKIGSHTDIFALGAFFLMTLTGNLPELGMNEREQWAIRWDHRTVKEEYLIRLLDAMLSPIPENRPDALSVSESLMWRRFIPKSQKLLLWPEHSRYYSFSRKARNDFSYVFRETYNGEHGYLVVYKRDGTARHFSLKQMNNGNYLENDKKTTEQSEYDYQFFVY